MTEAMRLLHAECPHQAALLALGADFQAAPALDRKTRILIGLAVLAALRQESRVAAQVADARAAGASRDEIIGAILASVPGGGSQALGVLPAVLAAYESVYRCGRD